LRFAADHPFFHLFSERTFMMNTPKQTIPIEGFDLTITEWILEPSSPHPVIASGTLLDEDSFRQMIAFERKRSERSGKAYALVLVSAHTSIAAAQGQNLLEKVNRVMATLTRDTDVSGWHKDDTVIGVIFTDIPAAEKRVAISTILARVTDSLNESLAAEDANQISISIDCYPEDWQLELSRRPSNPDLYPDIASRDRSRWASIVVKRVMDVVGSAIALILFAPVFVAIAIAIKLSSSGPVFFRQQRIGQHGKPFVLLKFRSMYMNSDASLHQQWFHSFYSGKAKRHATRDDNGNGSYKLPNDPRVTRIGRLLRRTSVDEVPQFINVLRGEMSLVGPRPPIPYEVDAYQAWHRGRVLQAKPGITGLWQVNGRSRVAFDEMVRLDLRYARSWSIWLDIKILLKTPAAVFFGEGAY
jgi:exopolysaccharide biosynthesis polyprenyl glycosylphosphotransferase